MCTNGNTVIKIILRAPDRHVIEQPSSTTKDPPTHRWEIWTESSGGGG